VTFSAVSIAVAAQLRLSPQEGRAGTARLPSLRAIRSGAERDQWVPGDAAARVPWADAVAMKWLKARRAGTANVQSASAPADGWGSRRNAG